MNEPEVFIFEISKDSFNTSVILNSYKLPVIVEFMAVWSEPCISVEADLAALATEFAGQFIFAKVDVDEQPELKEEYAIRNVPTLKVFHNGEIVRTEEGKLQKEELQALLKSYGIYRQSDELRQQARDKHMSGDTVEAVNLLTRAIQMDPKNTRVAMDMVQVFLDIGELEQATALFNKLPDRDKQNETGRSLAGQLSVRKLAANTDGKDALLKRLQNDPADNDARFDLAIVYVDKFDYNKAMEYLFDIFEQDPEYKQGAAREMIINLCNILADNEPQLAQQYRQRLGSAIS